jgi:predicted O-methyltransferase YrrM
VEFGTSFGISTIYLATALKEGGDRLVRAELEATKAQRARENPGAADLADLVEIRVGDALETLSDGVGGPVDWCCSTACSVSTCLCSNCSSRTCGPARR